MAHGTATDLEYADDPEALTPDNTIGLITTYDGIEGDALFDLRRLREAIVQFDMYYDRHTAEIGVRHVEHENGRDGHVLVLVPQSKEPKTQAIALACCLPVEADDG